MLITYHAGQRFLERVIKKVEFSKHEVHNTVEYLQRVFKDVVPRSSNKYIPLPGFENMYYAVCKDHSVITIIPKNKDN